MLAQARACLSKFRKEVIFMKNKTSFIALIFSYILMIFIGFFFYPKWNQPATEATISWDVSGYYMYLPAIFIYKDLKKCDFKDKILEKYRPTPDPQQFFRHQESANYVMKYSAGQAILMSPFFFLAHIIASKTNIYPADGFSYPYQICLGIGMFCYALIALYFFRKVLLHFFSDKVTAISLIILVFGTNYLNYSAIEQCLSHSTLFCIYSLLLYIVIKFYEKPSIILAFSIGFLTGLATLIRPTEIISLLLPIVWATNTWQGVKDRLFFFKNNWQYLAVSGLSFVGIVAIQAFYWKYVSGDWIVYSYGNQGFRWFPPYIKEYLFSYRSGWLMFTPMMIFAFIGLIPFAKHKQNRIAILTFLGLNLYIISAWEIWWYGGRAMVQSYPILMFLIATLIEALERKKVIKYLTYSLFILFIYQNLWWTYNSHRNLIQVSDLTWRYYWATVGRWSVTEDVTKYLDNKDSYLDILPQTDSLYNIHFQKDSLIVLDKKLQKSSEYFIKIPAKGKKWIRAYTDISCVSKEYNFWIMPRFVVKFYDGEKNIKTNFIRVHRFLYEGQRRELYIDAKIPAQHFDKISLSFDNTESDKISHIHALSAKSF